MNKFPVKTEKEETKNRLKSIKTYNNIIECHMFVAELLRNEMEKTKDEAYCIIINAVF